MNYRWTKPAWSTSAFSLLILVTYCTNKQSCYECYPYVVLPFYCQIVCVRQFYSRHYSRTYAKHVLKGKIKSSTCYRLARLTWDELVASYRRHVRSSVFSVSVSVTLCSPIKQCQLWASTKTLVSCERISRRWVRGFSIK